MRYEIYEEGKNKEAILRFNLVKGEAYPVVLNVVDKKGELVRHILAITNQGKLKLFMGKNVYGIETSVNGSIVEERIRG